MPSFKAGSQTNIDAQWQRAQQQVLAGRFASALTIYRQLVKLAPSLPQLWFELGVAAVGELEFSLADQAFQQARQLGHKDVLLLVALGQQYHRIRRLDKARACFQEAVKAGPLDVHARLSLAAWQERENRLDDSWECVQECLAGHPNHYPARYFQAFLLHRKGRNAEAETLLRDLIKAGPSDRDVHVSIRHLLGVVLDELGQYSEAIRWLGEAKEQVRAMAPVKRMEEEFDRADRQRRELVAGVTPALIRRWREQSPANHCAPLALLGGHPRSGTTLIERVLGAHPGILAFDESEAFALEIWNPLMPNQAAHGLTIGGLDNLSASRRAELTGRYRKSLLRASEGQPEGQLLLDKNPSSTMALPLWLRLFPHLKVIIALRDPRDVVISCFFQNLSLTVANVNFLSLQRTLAHYASLTDVWLRMRQVGGFDWIETRYEDVVSSLESEGRRVTQFTGVPWHSDQANHLEGASRTFIFAPTYHDVTKPVHHRAIGRWKHYAPALAPLMDQLSAYCRALGYPAEDI